MCRGACTHIYTQSHNLTEEFNKAALAVGLVVLLLEGAFVKLLEAEGAHKVLWVELLAHCGDAATGDGLLAARAQRATPLMVVRLTVRLALVVKEAAVYEWSEALLENQKRRGRSYDDGLTQKWPNSLKICQVAHPADEAFRVPE